MKTADRLAQEIKRRIVSGTYTPHSYLPSERKLGSEIGGSFRTVSAALETLAKEGLVIQTPGRGTRVLPPSSRMKHGMVGVVFHPAGSLEQNLLLSGVEDALARLEYNAEEEKAIISAEAAQSAGWKRFVTYDQVTRLDEKYDGLIFIETNELTAEILELERRKVPLVVANLEVDMDVSATWVDHKKSTMRGVEMLAALGHRRIAYVGNDPAIYFYGKALEGYREGLAKAGIPFDESRVVITKRSEPLAVYLDFKPLLEKSPRPTAVLCGRDQHAAGVFQALTDAGLTVGRDVSLLGFDNIGWEESHSFLTTFREPCHEMGAAAVEMLAERLVYGWRPPEKRELDAPVVLRRSVGPCPEAEADKSPSSEVLLEFQARAAGALSRPASGTY